MKVMTILGTRPEIIRLSRIMARLDTTRGIEHVMVHTGQNYDYELNDIFFEDLGVRAPDYFLNVSRESVGKAYGDILAKCEDVMLAERPDAVLILGDTNSAIATIIAKRMHIPTFHMEAGNRSFDHNVPEEVNRRIVDHTADFNLVYSEHARRNLLAEGLPARHIYLTGSPMKEVLDHQMPKIRVSTATSDLGMQAGDFLLFSFHREENVDSSVRLTSLINGVQALQGELNIPALVSLHPRTKKRIDHLGIADMAGVIFHSPFGFSDYCRLQLDARCVLSDSGTIAEESAILGFPAVTIRDSIERPEALDAGSIQLAGIEPVGILRSVELASIPSETVPPEYMVSDASVRVTRLISGLTGQAARWSGVRTTP
ncbi:MAG: non-hydrolyzing UDP-N-acetylglucosamine 2-epimerase [Acidimicrobiales bacterium]